MRYLPLLLCLACSSAPRQYMDGAPMRPPVPRTIYTPPGTGLPEYWSAPERKPDIQPGPRPTRALPQTDRTRQEPTIWASDSQDPPGWNDPAPKIAVLDVEIPMPEEVKTEWDARLAAQCAMRADIGLRTEQRFLARLRTMSKQEARCLAASAFAHCVFRIGRRLQDQIEDDVKRGTATASQELASLRVSSIIDAALHVVDRECGPHLPPSVRDAGDDIDGLMRTKPQWKGGPQ